MKNSNYDFWKNIWLAKGRSGNLDLKYLDGYDHLELPIDSSKICDKIVTQVNILNCDLVLEVGCGAGFLSRHMKDYCIYQGVDYCSSLVKLNQKLHAVAAFECEAASLFYPDKSMDVIFVYGLFQYLPSEEYARTVMIELLRVSRKAIFIGDVRIASQLDTHMVYNKVWFQDYAGSCNMIFTSCLYDENDSSRFNVCLFQESINE